MADDPREFLLTEGGPVVRARTARELMPFTPAGELAGLQNEVSHTVQANRWLERLQPRTGFTDLHGSKPGCFENVFAKLVNLGLRAGCPELDERAAPFRAQIDKLVMPDYGLPFVHSFLAGFLLMAGYTDIPILAEVRRRLERLAAFASPGWREIYIDPAPFTDIPKAFRSHRLVNPDLYPQGDSLYPLIYDLHAFAALTPIASPFEQKQIAAVVNYVLLPEYQRIEHGYGIMRAGPRRYFSIGWDCKLPGYAGLESGLGRSFIQRLVLMSDFSTARVHPWYRNALSYLDQFATGRGTWIFPRAFLPEKSAGYWVTGSYMGLEEDRRTSRALEIESTFWMAKLIQHAL